MHKSIGIVLLACLWPLLPACSERSEPDPSPPASTDAPPPAPAQAPPPKPSSGKIVTAPGFTYDPNDLTPGFPDVTTIRLGDRIRIWSRAATDWYPMTIALLDDSEISMVSFRLDVPPAGSITGVLPKTARPYTKIRITQCMTTLDNPNFTRRIGTEEPELTTPRLRDQRIFSKDLEKHPDPKVDPDDNHKILDQAIEAVTTELLKEQFGRDVILDGGTVYLSGSNPWKSRPVSDAEWLDGRIKAYLNGVSNRRRNPHGT